MERPKGIIQPVNRELTGEITYLDEMRRLRQTPKHYYDLNDLTIQLFEGEAAMYRDHGIHPPIMDLYEQYDRETSSELSMSCIGLAEELLALKESDSRMSFVDIVAVTPADQVLQKLETMKAGALLARDNEQLAIKSDGLHYPVIDMKKRDMTPTGVAVRAWGWSDKKYIFTNKPGEKQKYPENCLFYPSDERAKWYQLDIQFSYQNENSLSVSEILSLYISQNGDMHLSRQLWSSVYAEQGYEGHNSKQLDGYSENDIAKFADLIAEIVGDEPLSVGQYQDRQFDEYLAKVCIPESRAYIEEWIANSWSGQVASDIQRTRCGNTSLARALCAPESAQAAHHQLVALVDDKRARRNEAANSREIARVMGSDVEPWKDFAVRETATSE